MTYNFVYFTEILSDNSTMPLKSCMYPGMAEAGCDEAGRGCLAGPVFAAAVILPDGFRHDVLNDSKKLSPGIRELLRDEIIKAAVSWKVASVSNQEIDEMNILRASVRAMHLALEGLKVIPEHIIVDGNRFFPFGKIEYTTVIKGDSLYFSIAAASVLAKTFRDDFMNKIDAEFPMYGWRRNKGYATKDHRRAIEKFGVTPYHRKSFTLTDSQMEIDF